MLNLKTHVLRFWQTQFPQIAPLRSEKGQRLYTDDHILILRRIQYLLHGQGMTIDGARRVLSGAGDGPEPMPIMIEPEVLRMLQNELVEIRNILSSSEN